MPHLISQWDSQPGRRKRLLQALQRSNEQMKQGSGVGRRHSVLPHGPQKAQALGLLDNGAPSTACHYQMCRDVGARSSTGNERPSAACMALGPSNAAPSRWNLEPRGRKRCSEIGSHCCDLKPTEGRHTNLPGGRACKPQAGELGICCPSVDSLQLIHRPHGRGDRLGANVRLPSTSPFTPPFLKGEKVQNSQALA